MPWNDISNSQQYLEATPGEKFTIKSSYFDNYIAPDIPLAGRGAAKKKWMETDSSMINVAPKSPITPEVRSQNEFGADTLSDVRRRSAEYSTGTYRNPQVAAREIGEPGLARAAQRSVEQQALVLEQDTYLDKLGQAVGSGFRQSVEGDRVVRSGMGVGPDVEAPHRTGQIGGALGDLYERAKKAETDDEYTDIRHDALNRISDFYEEMPVKSPEVKGYWQQVGLTLAESGPNMLATAVLPAAGFSLNWGRAAGNKALELRQKGVTDPDLRNKVATGYGAVSAFGETVGDLVQFGAAGRVGKTMLKGIRKPGRKAAAGFLNQVKNNPVSQLASEGLKRVEPILSGATGEVASEVIDAYAGAAADVVATNPNGTMKEWREAYSKTVTSDKFKNDLAESVKIAAGAGAVIPGAAVALQTGVNVATAPKRVGEYIDYFQRDLDLGISQTPTGEVRSDVDIATPIMREAAEGQRQWAAGKRQELRELGFSSAEANATVNALSNLNYNPDQVRPIPRAFRNQTGELVIPDPKDTTFDSYEDAEQTLNTYMSGRRNKANQLAPDNIITQNESGKYVIIPRSNMRKDKIWFQRKAGKYFEQATPVIDYLESLVNSPDWKYHWLFKDAVDAGYQTKYVVSDPTIDSEFLKDNTSLATTSSTLQDNPADPTFATFVTLNAQALEGNRNFAAAEETLVHEQIHSLLRHKMGRITNERTQAFHRDLIAVWNGIPTSVVDQLRNMAATSPGKGYGYLVESMERAAAGNLYAAEELVTLALTSPHVAQMLNSIQVKGPKGTTTSLWARLRELIARFISPNKTKMDEVLEVLDKHAGIGIERAGSSAESASDLDVDSNVSSMIRSVDDKAIKSLEKTSMTVKGMGDDVSIRAFRPIQFIKNIVKWTDRKFSDRFSPIKAISDEAYRLARTFSTYKEIAAADFSELQTAFEPVNKYPKLMTAYFKALRDKDRAVRGIVSPGYSELKASITPQEAAQLGVSEKDLYLQRIIQEADKTKRTIEQTMADAGVKMDDIVGAVDAWKNWNKRRLDAAVESGTLSREQADRMFAMNPFYAAYQVLERLPDDLENLPISGTREYFSVTKPFTSKMKGTERQVGDVIEATLKKDMEARALFARNNVGRTLIEDMIHSINAGDAPGRLTLKEDIDLYEQLKRTRGLNKQEQKILNNLKEEYELSGVYRVADTPLGAARWDLENPNVPAIVQGQWDKRKFDTISFFKNGKLERYLIAKEYADAVKHVDPMYALPIITKLNTIFRLGATTYNPGFFPVNAARDIQAAFVSSDIWSLQDLLLGRFPKEYARAFFDAGFYSFGYSPETPGYQQKIARLFELLYDYSVGRIKYAGSLARYAKETAELKMGLRNNVDKPRLETTISRREKRRQKMREYFESGGGFGWTGTERRSGADAKRQLFNSRTFKSVMTSPIKAVWDLYGGPMRNINEALELAPRLATARRAVDIATAKKADLIEFREKLYQSIDEDVLGGKLTTKQAKVEKARRLMEYIRKNFKSDLERQAARAMLRKEFPAVDAGDANTYSQEFEKELRNILVMSGREATIDFNKAGSIARAINSYIPFFNAALRGSGKLASSLGDPRAIAGAFNPKYRYYTARVARSWAKLTVLVGGALMATMFNNVIGADDEEREMYARIPEYERENYFVLVIGKKWNEAKRRWDAKYVKLPKGEFGKVINPLENAILEAYGLPHKPHGSVLINTIQDILSPLQFLPYKPDEGFGTSTLINKLSPPLVQLILEPSANKDFFTGKAIEPEWMKSLPAWKRFYKHTPAEYKLLSKQLHEVGIEISPLILQNIGSNIAASTGNKPIDTVMFKTLITRLYGERGDEFERKERNIEWRVRQDYDRMRDKIMDLVEDGNTKEARQLAQKWNKVALSAMRDELTEAKSKKALEFSTRFSITPEKITRGIERRVKRRRQR